MNDSTNETQAHITRVQELLNKVCLRLMGRANVHDASKLLPPEKEAFDSITTKLKGLTYGSDEYRATLREMKPAIQHHYDHNTHHPEHYEQKECIICFKRFHRNYAQQCDGCGNGEMSVVNGLDGMSLLDVIEMFCDWKAAGERHSDSTMEKSIKHNQDRFKMSPQLVAIFHNTRKEFGWE